MYLFNHTKAFLTPHQPRTAKLYPLTKIHKPDHPGRHIVSSSGATTENIYQYVDHFLKPLVTGIPLYIRDTTNFLNRLGQLQSLPPVTLDVSSLYTNFTACKEALNHRGTQNSRSLPTNQVDPYHEHINTFNGDLCNAEQPWVPDFTAE